MVAMAIWCHLINYYFYQFVLNIKILKVTKMSFLYWLEKSYGRLNKKMAESAPGRKTSFGCRHR